MTEMSSSVADVATSYGDTTISGTARVHQGHHYGIVNNYYYQQQNETMAPNHSGNRHWQVRRRPNALFTGQADILESMEAALLPEQQGGQHSGGCRQYVLCGIGGAGKSELALQFAKKHRQRYWGVFWVDFANEESVESTYTQIAAKLGLGSTDGDIVEAVNDRLSGSRETWLLLLDNCDDRHKDYQDYFPENDQGTVIMTTRQDFGTQYGRNGYHNLEGLDPQSSMNLLLKISRCDADREENRAYAKSIVERLAYHTLAITVAGSLIGQSKLYSLQEYSELLKSQEHSEVLDSKMRELFNSQPKQAGSKYGTVFATFHVSAKKLEQSYHAEDHHALQLLGVLAFLDHTEIGEDIFARAYAYGQRIKNRGGVHPDADNDEDIASLSIWHYEKGMPFAWTAPGDKIPFRRARSSLQELSLITFDVESQTISMHPLVHSWARERLGAQDRDEAWNTCAATLALSLQEAHAWTDFTPKIQRHLETCFKLRPQGWLELDRFPTLEACRTFYSFAWQLCRGHSMRLPDLIKEIDRANFGGLNKADPTLSDLQVLHLKAIILSKRGQYNQALSTQSFVLGQRKILLPPDHESVLKAQHSLASMHLDVGQYGKATVLLEEVVSIRVRTLSSEDARLLFSQHELAAVYRHIGEIGKAVSLIKEVIEGLKTKVPPDHPYVLASQHELAIAYIKRGEFDSAVSTLEHVVKIRGETLGRTDVDRFSSEYNLIDLYIDNDQLEEAKNFLQSIEAAADAELLSASQKRDIQTLWNKQKFGASIELEKSGRTSEATSELKEVVENEQSLSDHDIEKWKTVIVLARLHLKGRGLDAAKQLLEKVKRHEDKLSEDWRQDLVNLEVALGTFVRTGQIPDWLFVWSYCRPECLCSGCLRNRAQSDFRLDRHLELLRHGTTKSRHRQTRV